MAQNAWPFQASAPIRLLQTVGELTLPNSVCSTEYRLRHCISNLLTYLFCKCIARKIFAFVSCWSNDLHSHKELMAALLRRTQLKLTRYMTTSNSCSHTVYIHAVILQSSACQSGNTVCVNYILPTFRNDRRQ